MFGWLSFIVCLGLSIWLVNRFIQPTGLTKRNVFLGFGIKLAFAMTYILLFKFYFGDGRLFGDSANFFYDAIYIKDIFKVSLTDFFRLLLGFEPIHEASTELLNQTTIWSVGPSSDWINDNRLILKLNALIHFISFENVYIHALIFGLLSFIGIALTYESFQKLVSRRVLFWFAIISFPNIAFWGTGLLKESLFILAFGLWCDGISRFPVHQKKSIILIILGGFILLVNKPYAGFVIIGFSAFYILGYYTHFSKKILVTSCILLVLLLSGVFAIKGKLNLTDKISAKQTDLNNLAKGGIAFMTDSSFCSFPHHQLPNFTVVNTDSIMVNQPTDGMYKLFGKPDFFPFQISPSDQKYLVYLIYKPSGSYIEPTLISNSPLQLLKNSGAALLNVLIRPFPSDNGDRLKYLSFGSNLVLILFLFYCIFKRRTLNAHEFYLMISLIATSLLIALLIGWSVPIFGAIVRYKIPVDLLLIILGFIILKPIHHETIS